MRHLLLLAWLLLAGCSAAPSGSAPTPVPTRSLGSPQAGQILPGQGVGEVRLGQSKKQVEKLLGAPEENDTNEFNKSQSYAFYYAKGLELGYDKDVLSLIACHAPADKWSGYSGATAEGLWMGSTPQEIQAKLGAPKEKMDQALKYADRGLWFDLDKSNQVELIKIMAPEK